MLPYQCRTGIRDSRAAFALLELLVAAAVIALIAALVLPAVNQSKNQVRASKCIDNSRLVGAAFKSYADNHRGQFVPFKQLQTAPKDAAVRVGEGTFTYWPDLLREFAGHSGIWHCPGCRNDRSGNFGIAYNQLLGAEQSDNGKCVQSESDLAKPARTVVFADADRIANTQDAPDQWQPMAATTQSPEDRLQFEIPTSATWDKPGARRAWNRHLGRATVVFADQHVDVLPVSQLGFQKQADASVRLWDSQ